MLSETFKTMCMQQFKMTPGLLLKVMLLGVTIGLVAGILLLF